MTTATMLYDNMIQVAIAHHGRPKNENDRKPGHHVHHIKPCCLFPLGRADKAAHVSSNLCWLTIPQHVEVHRLLTFIYPGQYNVKFAYECMLNDFRAELLEHRTKLLDENRERATAQVLADAERSGAQAGRVEVKNPQSANRTSSTNRGVAGAIGGAVVLAGLALACTGHIFAGLGAVWLGGWLASQK